MNNPEKFIKELGITYENDEVTTLVEFIKINGIYLIGKTGNMKVTEDLTSGLSFYNQKLKDAFDNTMLMYKGLFEFGIALILIAVIIAIFTDKNIIAIISGVTGGASIISQLLYKPIERLQRTVAKYTQLQLVYFNWFEDYKKYDSNITGARIKNEKSYTEIVNM